MNEELEKWIIMCCVLILLMVGVVGCAKPQVMHDQPKQPTTLETIGKMEETHFKSTKRNCLISNSILSYPKKGVPQISDSL